MPPRQRCYAIVWHAPRGHGEGEFDESLRAPQKRFEETDGDRGFAQTYEQTTNRGTPARAEVANSPLRLPLA
eukprot:4868942-Lingulodinium_polyedra.AAC.1